IYTALAGRPVVEIACDRCGFRASVQVNDGRCPRCEGPLPRTVADAATRAPRGPPSRHSIADDATRAGIGGGEPPGGGVAAAPPATRSSDGPSGVFQRLTLQGELGRGGMGV